MRNFFFFFSYFLPCLLFGQGTNHVKDIDGVVSIDVACYDDVNNWKPRAYYTGKGIQLDSLNNQPPFVDYLIDIQNAGEYSLFLLGTMLASEKSVGDFGVTARQRDEIEYNGFSLRQNRTQYLIVQILKSNGNVLYEGNISFNQSISPQSWMNKLCGSNETARVEFFEKGLYRLRVSSPLYNKAYLEKVVLSRNGYVPTGTGPEPTSQNQTEIYLGGFDPNVVLPPRWAFGVLYGGYTNQMESIELVERLVNEGYAIDAYWIDSWFWNYTDKGRGPKGYMNFEEDKEAYPDIAEMWSRFEQLNIKGGMWIWDCILREGNERVYDSFKKQGFFRNRFIETNRWHNKTGETICGNINFDDPQAVAYWKSLLKPFFDKGLDFLKLDRSSAIPYTKAAFEATQELGLETAGRGFVLSHLHTTYDPRHKLYPTKWTGDAKIAWAQPSYPDLSVYAMGAYKENIGMVADPKRSTYESPFLTHDAGGYDYFKSDEASDELYARWIQFASMNSVMTLFSQHYNDTRNHPYNYNPEIQGVFKKYTGLRMRLFPYIYTYALNTRLAGKKMIQGDGVHEYQYLLGDEILVAPVYEKGARTRSLYLPDGNWFDFDNGKKYLGHRYVTVDAPLDKMPIFVREGAIIPLRDYARSVELGCNHKLTLLVYPTLGASTFLLREDDGISNDYLHGAIASTRVEFDGKSKQLVINPVQGQYKGMPNTRKWVVEFHAVSNPRLVIVNGVQVDFVYSARRKVLEISIEQSVSEKIEIVFE